MKFISLWKEEEQQIFIVKTLSNRNRIVGEKIFGIKLPNGDVWCVMNINGSKWTFIKRSITGACIGPISGRYRYVTSDGALIKNARDYRVGLNCMSVPDAVNTLKTIDQRIFFDPLAINRNGIGVSYLKMDIPDAVRHLTRNYKTEGVLI